MSHSENQTPEGIHRVLSVCQNKRQYSQWQRLTDRTLFDVLQYVVKNCEKLNVLLKAYTSKLVITFFL